MGRKPLYVSIEARKNARVERNRQIRSDPDKDEERKRKQREYKQRKREQERLQKHGEPLALLADAAEQRRMLEEVEVDEEEVVETPAPPVDREEVTETYADLDDDALPGDLGGGFINNGYDEDQDGMTAQLNWQS